MVMRIKYLKYVLNYILKVTVLGLQISTEITVIVHEYYRYR